MNPAIIGSVIGAAVLVFGAAGAGISAWLISRRTSSGKVSTTEASVLWTQAQGMMAMMQAEKDKSEAQRDKFIDAYTSKVIPALDEIGRAVLAMSELLREINDHLKGKT